MTVSRGRFSTELPASLQQSVAIAIFNAASERFFGRVLNGDGRQRESLAGMVSHGSFFLSSKDVANFFAFLLTRMRR